MDPVTEDLSNEPLLAPLLELSVWKRGTQRAPHKPLLLLLALARVQTGGGRLLSFSEEVAPRLGELLEEFGPPRKAHHPEYPFWRLQNDGDFWVVPEREAVAELRGPDVLKGDAPPSVLEAVSARGGFSVEVYERLRSAPDLVNRLAARVLEAHFPASMHEQILDAVGMPWVCTFRQARSPAFRDELLRLYRRRCAVCGFDARLGSMEFGLEGAHVQWFSHGGPDEPSNGLLLCSLHHQALDRGAIGLSDERRLLVSQHLLGGTWVDDLLVAYQGEEITLPLEEDARVARGSIQWHREEVFRGPAR